MYTTDTSVYSERDAETWMVTTGRTTLEAVDVTGIVLGPRLITTNLGSADTRANGAAACAMRVDPSGTHDFTVPTLSIPMSVVSTLAAYPKFGNPMAK